MSTSTIRAFGSAGSALGQMWNPHGVAVDEQCIAVCDYDNNRVQFFDVDGTPLGEHPVPRPLSLCIHNHACLVLTPNGIVMLSAF